MVFARSVLYGHLSEVVEVTPLALTQSHCNLSINTIVHRETDVYVSVYHQILILSN